MQIKTVILLGNFSLGLINFVNLSITLFIQRFLRFFNFFLIKTRSLTFLFLGSTFFISMLRTVNIEKLTATCLYQSSLTPTGVDLSNILEGRPKCLGKMW